MKIFFCLVMNPTLFLKLILISGIIANVYAIKCWVCRSDGDPKCADPFDNTSFPITDCSVQPERAHLPGLKSTMCRKIRQKVDGKWRYLRFCAWLGEPGMGGDERYCLHRSGTYNIHIETCTCRSKDGCNDAPSTSSNLVLPFVSIYVLNQIFS
ncbi:UPAR/Ly6 domain-containing protein crok [Lepeophtheirus salmonis]|uniref:UPAR/Ly6 domain-containing protein crok n=1 Tax=Lepeophtheirus salmonis TaxID=72036 RepID=UPI001AE457A1|nr:uncharacterized protein LOC121129726 [Lepeophtheirus salmonis]